MKRCLACQILYEVPNSLEQEHCPACDTPVATVNGMQAYAPDLADESEGFKAEYFDELVTVEGRNFWFRARNRILIWAFGTYVPEDGSFLEIGCGNGFVLRGIKEAFPKAKLSGSEIFLNGLRFAADRLPGVTLMQMDARKIPFAAHFDAIGAFDVLEHIDEDEAVLAQVYAALKPGGHLILTVPQHMWLWSAMDEYTFHFRRYTARELKEKFEAAGFEIQRSTSFVSFLLPAMLAARLIKRDVDVKELDATAELRINPVLNTLFYWVMRLEALLIRLGLNFPVGGSRLIIAKKL